MPRARASRASCCCRRARSRSASWRRRSCTARRSWRSTATSTTRCGSCARSARPSRSRSSIRSTRSGSQGQKTASFEIIDVLGDAPDVHVLPVGNAGNISAYWMGYEEFHRLGRATKLPKMAGFQAAGSAPIFLRQGRREARDRRDGDPHRQSGELGARHRRDPRQRRLDRHRDRRRDPRRAAVARGERRHLRRARQRREHRRPVQSRSKARAIRRVSRRSPRAAGSSAPSPATA